MIILNDVSKKINKKVVLDHISYTFENGTIYGICGTNGSGKTMLLRAIAGLIIPTSGEIIVDNKVLHKDISIPNDIGIVIENMELPKQYNAFDNLKILSKIRNKASNEDIINSLKQVGLETDIKVKKYSLGMKQRLNIAQAIFENPKIILLDEPTNALDEQGVEQIYNVLRNEKEKGTLILIATHHKQDLESLCDVVLTMSEGKLNEK